MTGAQWERLVIELVLTPRELEVVQALFDSGSRCDVAETLGVTHETAKTYVKRVYEKLGATDRASLILRCFEQVVR